MPDDVFDETSRFADTTTMHTSRVHPASRSHTVLHDASSSRINKGSHARPKAAFVPAFKSNSMPAAPAAPSRPSSAAGRSLGAENVKDRFIPRMNAAKLPTGPVPEALADAFGVRMTRVLEFGEAPPLQRKFAPADFVSQYAHHAPPARTAPVRRIPSKPEKILDAPGLVDDFYLNVLDWSRSANVMAIGLGPTVYGWNPNTGDASVLAELEEDSGAVITAVKWAQGQSCLAVATSQGHVQLWDAERASLLRVMRGRRDRVGSLSWNEHVLSAGGRDGSIWNHDVRIKHHKIADLRGHSGEVCGLSWRGDGRVLASGGNDNVVNLWDARVTAAPQHALTQHQAAVKALAWCPWQNNLLATGGGSADQRVLFWNATSGACARQLSTNAQVTSLHWSAEHRELAATLGYPFNSVNVWSYPGLEPRATIEHAHDARILASTLSSDGQTLVTCSGDESLKMWNLFAAPQHKRRTDIAGILGRV